MTDKELDKIMGGGTMCLKSGLNSHFSLCAVYKMSTKKGGHKDRHIKTGEKRNH